MRSTTLFRIFLLILLLTSTGKIFGQNSLLEQPLQLDQKEGSLKEMIQQIEAASQIPISYSVTSLRLDKKVTLTGSENTLKKNLEVILEGEYIRIIVRKNKIILGQSDRPLHTSPTPILRRKTLSGYVRENGSGEALVGAAVYSPLLGKGTYTNAYGFFSLTLPQGTHEIAFQLVGYATQTIPVDFHQSQELDMALEPDLEVETIEISSEDQSDMHDMNVMGQHSLSMEKEGSLPVLLGEADILKTMQLLPGVHGGADGATGIYVRGGGGDQNLIYLDGVPVYNANHVLGIVSVFNSTAIKSASIVKGGFPARFSGRLSSMIDVRTKEGNLEKFSGEVGMGILSGRVGLEGPIIKGKSSFFISARRTWLDLLVVPIQKLASKTYGGYSFHDLNAKTNIQVSKKDRIYLSGYLGRDQMVIRNALFTGENSSDGRDESLIGWGNQIAAFRWNHIFSPKLFCNTALTYSRYNRFREQYVYQEQDTTWFNELTFKSYSEIKDFSGRIDFDYFPHSNHTIKFGAGNTYHTFVPSKNDHIRIFRDLDTTYSVGAPNKFAHEAFAYFEDNISFSRRLKVNLGFHLAAYIVEDQTYLDLQPRLSARYLLNRHNSLKFSFGQNVQYIHLLTNPGIGLPTDLWVPSTGNIRPSESSQASLGYYRTWEKGINFRTELFYKRMWNLLEYEEGYNYIDNSQDWENRVEVGKGWSYGAEVMLEKTAGKLTGWISYTWSKTERQFEELNFGRPFPFRYDRRHDANIALNYTLNPKVSFGAVWVYGTGNAMTLGLDRFQPLSSAYTAPATGQLVNIEQRNNFRTPSYHRLDLSINLDKQTKIGQRRWSFGLYNAYGNVNPSFVFARTKYDGSVGIFVQGLLPLVPMINYRIRF